MKKFIIDGFNVDVGQNARENDILTLGAASQDIWFHVENYPGSHVILRKTNRDITDGAIREVAKLAAVHSKRSGNVDVIYTEAIHVEKKRFSKAGEVEVSVFSRIKVRV
jgi:predicted ribosome quality control (RQC) complex YloA/Tae2 family protein